jgi:dsDNA-specific endonuclease/ATPase MutS2
MDEQEPVELPIEDTLDLHTFAPRDVKAAVETYLEEVSGRGWPIVRIIHGRGIGVQREIVRAILAESNYVESFHDAPPEAGGWGATVVTFKRSAAASR